MLQASRETLLTDTTFHLVMSALAVHLDSERIPYVFGIAVQTPSMGALFGEFVVMFVFKIILL